MDNSTLKKTRIKILPLIRAKNNNRLFYDAVKSPKTTAKGCSITIAV